MQTPEILWGQSLKRLVQGAVVGAAATAIIGFNWGGWTLGSTAKEMAETNANSAVAAALAPICVYKFQHASDALTSMAAFKKVESYNQSDFIEKGGWATMPGSSTTDSAVARACASELDAVK